MFDAYYLFVFLFLIGCVIIVGSTYIPVSNDPLQNNKIWIFYIGFLFVVISALLVFYKEFL